MTLPQSANPSYDNSSVPPSHRALMVKTDSWKEIAEDVLAMLLIETYDPFDDSGYFNQVYHVAGVKPYHFPEGKWRTLYSAILTLRAQNQIVNWHNLHLQTNDIVREEWYVQLLNLNDIIRQTDFRDNLPLLIEAGNRALTLTKISHAVSEIRGGGDLEESVKSLVSNISVIGSRKISDETAGAARSRLDRIFDQKHPPAPKYGVATIDEVMSMRTGRMCVIGGSYKSRKTTLLINALLNACLAGKSVALLSLENSIEMTQLQLIAMIAVRWLLEQGKVPYSSNAQLYWISADYLLESGEDYKGWAILKRQAVDYARGALDAMGDRFRFYDRSAEGGSLSTTSSIQSVVQRDMLLYGGEIFGVDHQQLVAAKGEIYESTRMVSGFFQALSRISDPHPIHLIVLAQLSEEAIKRKGGYSAGIKGGGDTSANADYVITTTPIAVDKNSGEYFNDRTAVQVKHNRWGASTKRQIERFHPQSGLHFTKEMIAQMATYEQATDDDALAEQELQSPPELMEEDYMEIGLPI